MMEKYTSSLGIVDNLYFYLIKVKQLRPSSQVQSTEWVSLEPAVQAVLFRMKKLCEAKSFMVGGPCSAVVVY